MYEFVFLRNFCFLSALRLDKKVDFFKKPYDHGGKIASVRRCTNKMNKNSPLICDKISFCFV